MPRTGDPAVAPARIARLSGIARQRRRWTRLAVGWDEEVARTPGLRRARALLVAEARRRPGGHAIDLGCGGGDVSIALACHFDSVLAVDVSPVMVRLTRHRATVVGALNLTAHESAIERLELEPGRSDLIVSSYALHHLRDREKDRLLERAATWLRPGGRIVIVDLMMGRGGEHRDRGIIAAKIAVLARRGPGGWWRIAKNLVRFGLRLQERPWSPSTWSRRLRAVGFCDVRTVPIVEEAAMVTAVRAPVAEMAVEGTHPHP